MTEVERELKRERPGTHESEQNGYNKVLASSEEYRHQSLSKPPNLTALENTPTPSEDSLQSHDGSPAPDGQELVGEWFESYRPSKRRRKMPRPGESTFRVPMSMEQRKSLGASVRPKDVPGSGIVTFSPEDGDIGLVLSYGEPPVAPVTRGGTKMKFRAYAPPPPPMAMANRGGFEVQSSSVNTTSPQFAMEQTSQQHQLSLQNRFGHDINFSAAPLENGPKLAWWLAQQISQMSSFQFNNILSPAVAEIPAQQFYGHGESAQGKKRLTDRERKARWRELNTERNRENDLRARVNRQARIKFGDSDSMEKSNWINSEITRRRARREEKQISQAAKSGHYPSFSNTEVIRNSLLRGGSTYAMHDHVERLKRLLVDVLFPSSDQADAMIRHQSMQALSTAISNRQQYDEEAFRAACASIAGDEVAFSTIKSAMEEFITEEDEEMESETSPKLPSQNAAVVVEHRPGHVVTKLNEALGILRQLHEIGNSQQLVIAKGSKPKIGPRKPSEREHRQHLKDFGITEAQVVDFLVLVNDGRLEPDPDDDIAVQLFGNDLEIEVPKPLGSQRNKTSNQDLNVDFWETVNSVLDYLFERCVPMSKSGRKVKKKNGPDESYVKSQVEKVKSLLNELGIGNNRQFSGSDSRSVSEFCNRLMVFKDTRSFGEDLPMPPMQAHKMTPPSRNGLVMAPHALSTGLNSTHPINSIITGLSPSASLPLPDATNPFANGDLEPPQPRKLPVSTVALPPRSPVTINQYSKTLAPQNSHVSLANSHVNYPQFRSVKLSGHHGP